MRNRLLGIGVPTIAWLLCVGCGGESTAAPSEAPSVVEQAESLAEAVTHPPPQASERPTLTDFARMRCPGCGPVPDPWRRFTSPVPDPWQGGETTPDDTSAEGPTTTQER